MLQVPVPAEWVDAIFLRVRALLDTVQARNVRMQSGKRQADDLIYQTRLLRGSCRQCCTVAYASSNPHPFPNMSLSCRYGMAYVLHRLPAVANIIMAQEYLDFAQQVMSSHDRADKQAEMDVSPALGDMLIEM